MEALLGAGQTNQARAILTKRIAAPESDLDLFAARVTMANSFRIDKNWGIAEDEFRAALDLCERSEMLRSDPRHLGRVLLGLADIIAFGLREPARAIPLYDRAAEAFARAKHPVSPDMVRACALNAAILSADLWRVDDALARVDRLLASPVRQTLRDQDVIALRFSAATWLHRANRIPEARARHEALWNDYPASLDRNVIRAGLELASWSGDCARRVRLLSAVIERLELARGRGWSPTEWAADIGQVRARIADSSRCAAPELPDLERRAARLGALQAEPRPIDGER